MKKPALSIFPQLALSIVSLMAFCGMPLHAAISVYWSSGVALPGEKVMLYLVDPDCGNDPFNIKAQPKVADASIQVEGYRIANITTSTGSSISEIIPIGIIPDAPGSIAPEPITVTYKSGRVETITIPPLPVVATSQITWFDKPTRYGALWYFDKKDPYVNEPIKASLKFLIPVSCEITSLPHFETAGLRVTPFNFTVQGVLASVQERSMPNPTALAHGKEWRIADFSGEISALQAGSNQLVGKSTICQIRGFHRSQPYDITIPSVKISALPLPPGEPANFDQLVGEYSVSSSSDAKELAMHETIDVSITVMGSGNITNMPVPTPREAQDWKLTPPTRKAILNANGETIGMRFHQLMRPLKEVDAIPSFELNYFNPDKMEYACASSKPIPLSWRAESSFGVVGAALQISEPPPAGSIPIAEMRDIYGPRPAEISLADDLGNWGILYIIWREYRAAFYALLFIPALILLICMLIKWIKEKRSSSAGSRAIEQELRQVSEQKDDIHFLKGIGRFIESRLSREAQSDTKMHAILEKRDEEVFRPAAQLQLSSGTRKQMLKQVRAAIKNATLGIICLLCIPIAEGSSELSKSIADYDKLYSGGQYSTAIGQMQTALNKELSDNSIPNEGYCAELLYRIGNCYYRLEKPGEAAICYARALSLYPSLKEAEANLHFIQRKQGAIVETREIKDEIFNYLSKSQLELITAIALALLFFCILRQIQLGKQRSIRIKLCYSLAILLSLACSANWLYYLTQENKPISTLAAQQVAYATSPCKLLSSADQEGALVVDLPASTALKLLAKRADWSYVETAQGSRGWVRGKDIKTIIPLH